LGERATLKARLCERKPEEKPAGNKTEKEENKSFSEKGGRRPNLKQTTKSNRRIYPVFGSALTLKELAARLEKGAGIRIGRNAYRILFGVLPGFVTDANRGGRWRWRAGVCWPAT
jgi:hypothetical protein